MNSPSYLPALFTWMKNCLWGSNSLKNFWKTKQNWLLYILTDRANEPLEYWIFFTKRRTEQSLYRNGFGYSKVMLWLPKLFTMEFYKKIIGKWLKWYLSYNSFENCPFITRSIPLDSKHNVIKGLHCTFWIQTLMNFFNISYSPYELFFLCFSEISILIGSKKFFKNWAQNCDYFLTHQFSHKVLGTQKNETVLLSSHNICFCWEIRKLIFNYALI